MACTSPEPVLIVGAGPAGLSAAIEASQHTSVVVLEANAEPGGSARWASAVTVVPSQRGQHPRLDPLKTEGIDWLTTLGVSFGPTAAPAPRGFQASQPRGGGPQVVAALVSEARSNGVELRTGCAVTSIRHDSVWTAITDKCGSFSAPRLVLATGSMLGDDAARRDWLGEETPRLSPKTTATTGLSLTAQLDVDVDVQDRGRVLWFDHISPVGTIGRTLVAPPSTVALSAKGLRIPGALRGWGPGEDGVAWAIVSGSEQSRTQLFDVDLGRLVPLSQHLDEGGGKLVADLADMAEYTGISKQHLTKVLQRHTPRGLVPAPEGPHAVLQMVRAPAKQLGGLSTDARGQVLDAHQQPIPGLFAAGELTGFHGMHSGADPIDSTMVVGAVVTGRIAGKGATHPASE